MENFTYFEKTGNTLQFVMKLGYYLLYGPLNLEYRKTSFIKNLLKILIAFASNLSLKNCDFVLN